jgi:hypothetical protein
VYGGRQSPPGLDCSSNNPQDGKGNVWAVEPKMQVEVEKDGDALSKVTLETLLSLN